MMLVVEDLSCARGGVPVLRGVSFALSGGEALILRGPNGSGKTTLLRTLAGLAPPAAGQVTCAEAAIAYAGHADGLKGQASVSENLAFWARIFATGDHATAMAAFGLGGLADRCAGDLSAGQKRRLGLARLLVTGRPIWCLDEPTVSLDADNAARFVGVVARHLAAGGAAIIATHVALDLPGSRTLDLSAHRARAGAGDTEALDDPFAAGIT